MKIHDYVFYIKESMWDKFKSEFEQYGFTHEGGFAYPDFVYRKTDDGKVLKIHISDPCVNMWDGEDKNKWREIWLWEGNRGCGRKEVVLPYIQDLVNEGFVDEN